MIEAATERYLSNIEAKDKEFSEAFVEMYEEMENLSNLGDVEKWGDAEQMFWGNNLNKLILFLIQKQQAGDKTADAILRDAVAARVQEVI